MFEAIYLKRTYVSFPICFRYSISWLYDRAVTNRTVPGVKEKMVWIQFADRIKDSHEASCKLQQIKKEKIDYIMEANTTIKKKKLSFSKQEISMPL